MGPSSRLQPFPIKLDCIAIHKLPYLHFATPFMHIINVYTETELDRLICFSSYQHIATSITNVTTMVSALMCRLCNMTSTFCWPGLPTLDYIQNAGAPSLTAKSKGYIRGFQQRWHVRQKQRSYIPHFTKICDVHLVHKRPNTCSGNSEHLITKHCRIPKEDHQMMRNYNANLKTYIRVRSNIVAHKVIKWQKISPITFQHTPHPNQHEHKVWLFNSKTASGPMIKKLNMYQL